MRVKNRSRNNFLLILAFIWRKNSIFVETKAEIDREYETVQIQISVLGI